VAPDGDDRTGDGSRARPFACPARARDELRQSDHAGEPVDVVLAHGHYELDETFVLGSEDSGSPGAPVVYRVADGARVVLSAGRRVTGLEVLDTGVWQAPSPVRRARQLYVDGLRATRARRPKVGTVGRVVDYDAANGFDVEANAQGERRLILDSQTGAALVGLSGPEFDGVEVVTQPSWTVDRFRVAAAEPVPGGVLVTPREPERTIMFERVWPPRYAGAAARLENLAALLEDPGEWILDRASGLVRYLPLPGQDPATVEVVMPHLETAVALRGTADLPVHDIHFVGIELAHSGWSVPDRRGYIGLQGSIASIDGPTSPGGPGWRSGQPDSYLRPPGLVELEGAEDITLERCWVHHAGGDGIVLVADVARCRVVGCRVEDVSGTGIAVDMARLDDLDVTAHHCVDVVIANNVIRRAGAEYDGSLGIFAGFTRGLRIEHNEISDLPYSGINVGWGWCGAPTALADTVVRANHIHHVVQGLQDGAAVYTLSWQSPTQSLADGLHITENHIHGIRRSAQAGHRWPPDSVGSPVTGIYLDNGSAFVTIRDNVIDDVDTDRAGLEGGFDGVFIQPGEPPASPEDVVMEAPAPDRRHGIVAAAGLQPAFRDLLA
jgi:hypothetical protein